MKKTKNKKVLVLIAVFIFSFFLALLSKTHAAVFLFNSQSSSGNDQGSQPAVIKGVQVYDRSGEYYYTIPEGVSYMRVRVWGAGSGTVYSKYYLCDYYTADGAAGGYSEGVYPVSPGDQIRIIVGARGSVVEKYYKDYASSTGGSSYVYKNGQLLLYATGGTLVWPAKSTPLQIPGCGNNGNLTNLCGNGPRAPLSGGRNTWPGSGSEGNKTEYTGPDDICRDTFVEGPYPGTDGGVIIELY